MEKIQPDLPWHLIWPRLGDHLLGLWRLTSTSPSSMVSWGSRQTSTTGMELPLLAAFSTNLQCPRRLSSIFSPASSGSLHAACHLLFFWATLTLGQALTDVMLLFLAWPFSAARLDAAVVLATVTFAAWAWATRHQPDIHTHTLKTRDAKAAKDAPLPPSSLSSRG